MQRNIRKLVIFAGLPLAAIALAVFLLSWGAGSGQKAQATTDGVNFSLTAGGCDSSKLPIKCQVTAGSQFTVAFNLNSLGTAPAYSGYDTQIAWSGNVNYILGSLKQQGPGTWDNGGANGCVSPGSDLSGVGVATPVGTKQVSSGGIISFGCIQGGAATPSTYSKNNPNPAGSGGALATLGFDCKAGGSGTITLFLGLSSDVVDPGLVAHNEKGAQTEALTVNCNTPVPATNTPTLTPTATPPANPFIFKSPALQNVFLTRQGNKIPPQTCEAGTDTAVLNETLGGPIVSPNPKGGPGFQQLGAFEFEMRFDDKMVCVSVVAGPLFSGPAATCASVRAKGILRFGCFTTKKNNGINGPGTLAIITVKPQPELYSQLRPNQDNGIPVQILNQGCQLSDEQGHQIAISSCEDADITFRFLEGDVTGPDCLVNSLDAQNIAMRWGATKGSLLFNSFLDLSPSGQIKGDGRIDIKDLQFVFGRLNSSGIRSKGGNLTCPLNGTPWPPQLPVNPKKP